MHKLDCAEPQKERRKTGRFFTQKHVSEGISTLVRSIDPEYIIEPYIGTGSLIKPLIEQYRGVGNDIQQNFIEKLKQKYRESKWTFTSLNTITTNLETLFERWKIPQNEKLLIFTNPPFGTASTNKLVSKKGELNGKKSRKIQISYGGLGDQYGRGDLVIPALGKCIEIMKRAGKGHIATFSPAGVMLNRYRYRKLFRSFLKDFQFKDGYIFRGDNFNSVSSQKPISLTIWQYKPNFNQNPEKMSFWYGNQRKWVKKLPLLKEGWRYDTRKPGKKEIAVQGNDRFNAAPPKIFHSRVKKGGSLLVQKYVKKELNIPHLPDPLIYGLWSVTVGHRAIADHPIVFDNCYTHLPDFTRRKSREILSYSLLHSLISELLNNYCGDLVGFFGKNRKFRFGGKHLTEGAKYLINTFGECSIGENQKTLGEIFKDLKGEDGLDKGIGSYRTLIKEEIQQRLEEIGYWDFLPISEIKEEKKAKGLAKIKGIGPKLKKKLEECGYLSFQDITNANIHQLKEIEGVGDRTAEKILNAAKNFK